MVRRAHRLDANHAVVAAAFRSLGATVVSLAGMADGIPDLLIGVAKQARLVEIKADAKAKFTPDQLDFMTLWNGPPVVRIESIDQAAQLVNLMRSER